MAKKTQAPATETPASQADAPQAATTEAPAAPSGPPLPNDREVYGGVRPGQFSIDTPTGAGEGEAPPVRKNPEEHMGELEDIFANIDPTAAEGQQPPAESQQPVPGQQQAQETPTLEGGQQQQTEEGDQQEALANEEYEYVPPSEEQYNSLLDRMEQLLSGQGQQQPSEPQSEVQGQETPDQGQQQRMQQQLPPFEISEEEHDAIFVNGDREALGQLLARHGQYQEARIGQTVPFQVLNAVDHVLPTALAVRDFFGKHPDLKARPNIVRHAAMAAREQLPDADEHGLLAKMEEVIGIAYAKRGRIEEGAAKKVDLRPSRPAGNAGTPNARGRATPPQSKQPMDPTQQALAEIANYRKQMRRYS